MHPLLGMRAGTTPQDVLLRDVILLSSEDISLVLLLERCLVVCCSPEHSKIGSPAHPDGRCRE